MKYPSVIEAAFFAPTKHSLNGLANVSRTHTKRSLTNAQLHAMAEGSQLGGAAGLQVKSLMLRLCHTRPTWPTTTTAKTNIFELPTNQEANSAKGAEAEAEVEQRQRQSQRTAKGLGLSRIRYQKMAPLTATGPVPIPSPSPAPAPAAASLSDCF